MLMLNFDSANDIYAFALIQIQPMLMLNNLSKDELLKLTQFKYNLC